MLNHNEKRATRKHLANANGKPLCGTRLRFRLVFAASRRECDCPRCEERAERAALVEWNKNPK